MLSAEDNFSELFSAHNESPQQYAQRLTAILQRVAFLAPHRVPLADALGQVLAEPIDAALDSPSFDNSQMDGYVLTAADALSDAREFTVGHDIPAGFQGSVDVCDRVVHPIMTGAPIPQGFSAVVPVERSQAVDSEVDAQGFVAEGGRVRLPEVEPGTFVRTAGEDIRRGTRLVDAGTVLGAVHLGVLAGQGIGEVLVHRRPRVLVYTGGEEVQANSGSLQAGKIYDANAPLLTGLLAADKITEVTARRITDDAEEFQGILATDSATYSPDLVVTCGGISAGRYEVVRNALNALAKKGEADCWFGHISQQPGGPQGVSVLSLTEQRIPVISLPGNPVSTLVTYTRAVRVALNAVYFLGVTDQPVTAQLSTTDTVKGLDAKTQFRRGTTTMGFLPDGAAVLTAEIKGGAGSHLLHAASESNCLIELEPGREYKNKDAVRIWYLPD